MWGSVWEPSPLFPTTAASVAWTGPGYQAGGGGRTACIAVTPPRVLEEPFRVFWGRVDFAPSQGRGSSRPGPVIEGQRAAVCVRGVRPLSAPMVGLRLASLLPHLGSGRVLALRVGTVRRVWFVAFLWVPVVGGEPPRRDRALPRFRPASGLHPHGRTLPWLPRASGTLQHGVSYTFCDLILLPSSGFPRRALQPIHTFVPTVLSCVLARALWGLAEGGTSAASVGHRPRAAC